MIWSLLIPVIEQPDERAERAEQICVETYDELTEVTKKLRISIAVLIKTTNQQSNQDDRQDD